MTDAYELDADAMPAMGEGTKTVFWPRKLRPVAGFLYGFCNAQDTYCIAGILPCETLELAQTILQEREARLKSITAVCGQVELLGICQGPTSRTQQPDHHTLQVSWEGTTPVIDKSVIIKYDPPDPRQLRFLSARPLHMAITTYSPSVAQLDELQEQAAALTDKVRQSLDMDPGRPHISCLHLYAVIQQINSVHEIREIIEGKSAKTNVKDPQSRPSGSIASSKPFRVLEMLLLAFLALLNYRAFKNNALKDVSLTAHQLDVRLRQALSAPAHFRASYKRERASPGTSRAHYIGFYGTLWLVANDVIIGSAVMAFLCENADFLSLQISILLRDYSVKGLQDTLLWLNNWPGGLKLNYELGKFFCDAFLWITTLWEEVMLDRAIIPYLPFIIYLVGLSAALGTTMSLSLASDLLAIATLHLYAFYFMATAIFSFHTRAMGSLYNIFRGKKRNVLRNRVEPSDYSLDQLLVGSLLFTLAVFLFPTVLAYYLVFAASRCCVIFIHATFEAALAFLNHFPLFAVMLRIKDPQRLPGGLRLDVDAAKGAEPVLIMKNNPIPLSAIFYQYWALWRTFSQHYSPIYLVNKLLSGRYIEAIPRSRLTFAERATTTPSLPA